MTEIRIGNKSVSSHSRADLGLAGYKISSPAWKKRTVSYRFRLHEHPYVQTLIDRLLSQNIKGLQDADTDYVRQGGEVVLLPDNKTPKPKLYKEFFEGAYEPTALVPKTEGDDHLHPVKELDFSIGGAYSLYNWEVFYHVPLVISMHLSKSGRYAEAQRCLHYIYDPTSDSDDTTSLRYWKVRPFHTTEVKSIEAILKNLASDADPELGEATRNSIAESLLNPFRPHAIARLRHPAYMYKAVFAYLDNLIAWGDSLFRQDTGEAIDEAMILYVLAANILGPRPQAVPRKGSVRPQTYANLRKDLVEFGVVERELEAEVAFDLAPLEEVPEGDGGSAAPDFSKALYFGVPRNDKLVVYWDTVADRLFKIRNSLDIQGRFRQLALFEPPIDPGMLARAAAAGLDIGAIVNGLNQPLPIVRFRFLVQKANEIVQEVKSLGNALLSAMEKEDGEAMAILRARHERVVLGMVEQVRYGQYQEAIKAREGVLASLNTAVERFTFYEKQLGRSGDEIETQAKDALDVLGELDRAAMEKLKLKMKEPAIAVRGIDVDIASDLNDSGGVLISSHEAEGLAQAGIAHDWQLAADILAAAASAAHFFPTIQMAAKPWGVGGSVEFGGQDVGAALNALAGGARAIAGHHRDNAANADKIGAFARRELDWTFQSNLAASEMNQIYKQLRAAQIREAVAELEWKNHKQQIQHAEEVEEFLNAEGANKNGKKANRSLYAWMRREVRGLHSQAFQFAFEVAKKAERALQHELGRADMTFLKYDYMAGKEGLLAGEKLALDVKRMEMAYHESNEREYEMSKDVSICQIDPLALVQLRETGKCSVRIPEAVFDLDGPGHYFRRLRRVAVSIPCVTGPYASINCTLTLVRSSIRKNASIGDGYARLEEDARFDDHFGKVRSIVTSTGRQDSGLFEEADERYLPFENAGAISEWTLELPDDPSDPTSIAQFDYRTITDVILHMRYSAREGGGPLRDEARGHLKQLLTGAEGPGCVRLFSVRHEFPTEWARFRPGDGVLRKLSVKLRPEHYPLWCGDAAGLNVEGVRILARTTASEVNFEKKVPNAPSEYPAWASLAPAGPGTLVQGALDAAKKPLPSATGDLELWLEGPVQDLWLAVTWSR